MAAGLQSFETGTSGIAAKRNAVVAASFAALVCSMPAVSLQTLGLFLGPITRETGWSRTTYFLGSTCGVLLIAATAPLLGRLADRFGIRAVLIPGVIGYALALAAMSLTPRSAGIFIALNLLVFLFGQIHTYQLYARAVTAWTDRSRGFMLAVMMTGTAVGNLLMPRLAAWLIEAQGWRTAYLGLGAIVLVFATPIAVFMIREPTPSERRHLPSIPTATTGLALGEAARTPAYWLLLLFSFISNFAFYGVLTNLVPLLGARGNPVALGVDALSAVAVSQFFGRLASGWFLDRVQTPRISLIWFGLSTVGMILLAVHGGYPMVIAAALLIGIAWGAEAEMNSFFVSRYFGLRAFAQINATVYSSIALAGALGPLSTAMLADRFGTYDPALTGAIGLMVVSCLLLGMLGPYRYLPSSPAAAKGD